MYDEVKVEQKGLPTERFRARNGKKVEVLIHERNGRATIVNAEGNTHCFPASAIIRGFSYP